jgi:hypothetical protein
MEGLPEKKEKQMRHTIALLATMAMMHPVSTSPRGDSRKFATLSNTQATAKIRRLGDQLVRYASYDGVIVQPGGAAK